MIKKVFFALTLLYAVTIHSVFSSIHKINEVKNRILIVLLLAPPDHNMLAKDGKDKTYIDEEDSLTNVFNANIRLSVTKYWSFSSNYMFTTLDTLQQLMEKDSKKYAVLLYLNTYSNAYDIVHKSDYIQLQWEEKHNIVKGYNRYILLRNFENTFSRLSILLNLTDSPIYEGHMPKGFPSEANLKYGLDQIQNEFENNLAEKDAKTKMKLSRKSLKDLTLLIPSEDLLPGLTEKEIKELYPYNFQISSYDEIQKKILAKAETFACLIVIPEFIYVPNIHTSSEPGTSGNSMTSGNNQHYTFNSGYAVYFNHYITTANKNELLAYSKTSRIAVSKYMNTNRAKISKEYFKDYLKAID